MLLTNNKKVLVCYFNFVCDWPSCFLNVNQFKGLDTVIALVLKSDLIVKTSIALRVWIILVILNKAENINKKTNMQQVKMSMLLLHG